MSTRIAKRRATMRKEPRQARSRATVDAIVGAGARVLAERGWAGFTTNGVAEIAGVSIGSLYQYFPDKLSLVEAIRKRHFDDVLGVLRAASKGDSQFSERIEALVDGLIEAHSVNPTLHRVLLDEVPGYDGSRSADDVFRVEYLAHYTAVVATCRGSAAGSEIAAQILSSAMEGIVHNAARSGTLTTPALKQELIALAGAYLRGPDGG